LAGHSSRKRLIIDYEIKLSRDYKRRAKYIARTYSRLLLHGPNICYADSLDALIFKYFQGFWIYKLKLLFGMDPATITKQVKLIIDV